MHPPMRAIEHDSPEIRRLRFVRLATSFFQSPSSRAQGEACPALKDSNFPWPSFRMMYSADMLRALLPVHKNKILKG